MLRYYLLAILIVLMVVMNITRIFLYSDAFLEDQVQPCMPEVSR